MEAQILETIEVDYIDESEVLTMADEENHINKNDFKVPFVCGCRDLGEALRRICEGAAMLRTKGEAGTGNIVEAVRHARAVQRGIKKLTALDKNELFLAAKELRAPYELVRWVAANGRLPVVNFAAGGVATPADAVLMMQLGMDGVFVGSGIFKSGNPEKRARAIVEAVAHFKDPKIVAEVSRNLGAAMVGITDLHSDPVNFRDREGGNPDGVPKKKVLTTPSEQHLYGSSWDGHSAETKLQI